MSSMVVTIDGAAISTFHDFVTAVARAVHGAGSLDPYFGFDLHSFQDCLFGGFGGAPPYEIEVHDAETMLQSFGRAGLAAYCDDMLTVIDGGGRGLVEEDSRHHYVASAAAARLGQGPTLLDSIREVIATAPASLVLVGADGGVLMEVRGEGLIGLKE